MRSPALFAFIGACSLLSVSLSAGAVVLEGRVTSVADGDTIRVQTADGSIRIRFLGIDAPESDQEFGAEAKTALTQLILHKRVLVKTDSNDQYGRALAQVAYQNHDVGLYMLEHGYAWVYQRYIGSIDEDWQDAYMAAERAAKEDGLGLWQSIGPVPPWTWRKAKRDQAAADAELNQQAQDQSFESTSQELKAKFSGLTDAVRNAADQNTEERDRLEKKQTWWQMFSDFGEVLSRWIVAFFRSFL